MDSNLWKMNLPKKRKRKWSTNTRTEGKIGPIFREDVGEYPPFAIREALTNALLHSDYSMTGCHIQIAIFDDRIEFTNPGGLPFGQTIQKALQGFSRLRNRVIGRVFKELNLIEQWGSGLQRIIAACKERNLKEPTFEDFFIEFQVTLYAKKPSALVLDESQKKLVKHLKKKEKISTRDAALLWNIAPRNARVKLKQLLDDGIIKKVGRSPQDPHSFYVLVK